MVLVHVCCADCGLKLIDAIKSSDEIDYRHITLYFYNPNIHPEQEHLARQQSVQKIANSLQLPLVIESWRPAEYFRNIAGVWNNKSSVYPAKSLRCPACFALRLTKTFAYAKGHGFDTVSSTLVTSIYHDTEIIRALAKGLSEKYQIKFLEPENINHCLKTGGIYKQNYEGCVYSLLEKMSQKYAVPLGARS